MLPYLAYHCCRSISFKGSNTEKKNLILYAPIIKVKEVKSRSQKLVLRSTKKFHIAFSICYTPICMVISHRNPVYPNQRTITVPATANHALSFSFQVGRKRRWRYAA